MKSLFIRKDAIQGTGVIANKKFSTGEIVAKFTGKKITTEKANELYNQGFDYLLQIGKDTFLKLDSDLKYVNHSCEPNCAFFEAGILTAIKPIEKGEEITFDYSLNEDTPFELDCLCGTPSCRKKIGPYNQLSEDNKMDLRDLVSPFLRITTMVYVRTDKNTGDGYIDLEDLKGIMDISKVRSYTIERRKIDRMIGESVIVVKFYDKDGNIIKP